VAAATVASALGVDDDGVLAADHVPAVGRDADLPVDVPPAGTHERRGTGVLGVHTLHDELPVAAGRVVGPEVVALGAEDELAPGRRRGVTGHEAQQRDRDDHRPQGPNPHEGRFDDGGW
jgi:hypothetical protein